MGGRIRGEEPVGENPWGRIRGGESVGENPWGRTHGSAHTPDHLHIVATMPDGTLLQYAFLAMLCVISVWSSVEIHSGSATFYMS